MKKLLLFSFFLFAFGYFGALVVYNPYLINVNNSEIKVSVPENIQDKETWLIAPFYYLILAWPLQFDNSLTTIQLPYGKGPPNHFIPEIRGSWNESVQFQILGPKTLVETNRMETKSCFLKLSLHCYQVRKKILQNAVGKIYPNAKSMKIEWFQVANHQIPEKERLEGVLVKSTLKEYKVTQALIFSIDGQMMNIRLKTPNTPSGERALNTFYILLSSARLMENLTPGRAQILRQLRSKVDRQKLPALYKKQIQLVSFLTTAPGDFESYFTLSTTSYEIFNKNKSRTIADTIKASFLYAKDLNPNHPKTKFLQEIFIDTQQVLKDQI